jgi:serine/threonine protein kinase
MTEIRIGHYRLGEKIGCGSFGDLFHGHDVETDEIVAIKLESLDAKYPQLAWEYKIYNLLAGQVGFPKVHYYGVENEYSVLIMECLGPSLEVQFVKCRRKFSMGTVAFLAIQMISRIQQLHSIGYVHRDVKPDNFLLGLGKDKRMTVYLIDFGLAKKYRKDDHHIPFASNKSLIGTARYASLNNHLGFEQSRRDDLEAVGYLIIYLAKGHLPWQGIKPQIGKSKYQMIGQCKRNVSNAELCKGLPLAFHNYMKIVHEYGFEQDPNYDKLRGLFQNLVGTDSLLDLELGLGHSK